MKKIIATVLAMVMAMALCVTAFAAVKYTAYDKTGKEIAKDVTYETCKAEFDKKAGDGMVAHYDVTMNGVTSYYVVAADAKTYDLKLTTSGKAPLYLVQVDSPYYVAKAVAFKAVGDGCGQLDVDTDETYYTSTKDDVVTYYVADKKAGCLYPAQCLTVAASMFLENDAARAKKVLAEAKPYFKSKDEYLAAIDNLTMDKDAVIYNEDGTVTLDFCQR